MEARYEHHRIDWMPGILSIRKPTGDCDAFMYFAVNHFQ